MAHNLEIVVDSAETNSGIFPLIKEKCKDVPSIYMKKLCDN